MKHLKNLTYITIASAAAMGITGCGKYEDGPSISLRTKKARVAGDWKVVSVGSTVMGADYSVNLSLEKSGSLTMTYSYSYGGSSYTYSYAGSWDFVSDKEQIRLTVDGNVDLLEIKRLTNDEMWLDDDITSVDGDIWKLEAK